MLFQELDTEIKWEDLVKQWKLYCAEFPILKEKIKVEKIPCDKFGKQHILGYDIIPKNMVKERKQNVNEFMLLGEATNKGTLHTMNMLQSAKSDEERMAIWCYAFISDMGTPLRLKQDRQYAMWLEHKCSVFLNSRFYTWHHAMRRLTPEIYYDCIFDGIVIRSIDALIELVALNAKMVLEDYQLVLYSSLDKKEEMKGIKKFNLRIDKG